MANGSTSFARDEVVVDVVARFTKIGLIRKVTDETAKAGLVDGPREAVGIGFNHSH
jgi:hypothetical protein